MCMTDNPFDQDIDSLSNDELEEIIYSETRHRPIELEDEYLPLDFDD